jgi:hypothetical protein
VPIPPNKNGALAPEEEIDARIMKDSADETNRGMTSQLANALHQVPRSGTAVEAPAFRPVNRTLYKSGLQARQVLKGHDFSRAVKVSKRTGALASGEKIGARNMKESATKT